jgi:hypothetical protein
MNRYPTNSDTRRWDGKRVHLTTTYPLIPISFSDIYIIATETDYLDVLAKKYYGDQTLWWVIAQANGIKATLKAPTGQQLRIPRDIQSILTNFFSENK